MDNLVILGGCYRCEVCIKEYSSYKSLWNHNNIYHKVSVNKSKPNVIQCKHNVNKSKPNNNKGG
jgi:hypothetical protein